jgi:hypothetical protein
LIRPPAILGSTIARLPRSPELVDAVVWIGFIACILAMVGIRGRAAAWVAAVLGVYAGAIPNLYGKVDHGHHLVVLAFVVAASPCWDALAVDAIGRRKTTRSPRYGFPVRVAWLVVGIAYLFPGLAKLSSFRHWLTAENMRGLIDVQQWAYGSGPFVPERLLYPAALGTIVFEIGFIFFVFNRRLRPFALLAGLAFHLSTWVVLGINFWPLWVLYLTFVDWGPRAAPSDERMPPIGTRLVAGIGVGGMLITGFTYNVNAWPVAAYPTFDADYRQVRTGVDVRVEALTNGRARRVELIPWLPQYRRPGLMLQLARVPRFAARLARERAPGADRIRVWIEDESILRANRGEVVGRRLVLDLPVRGSNDGRPRASRQTRAP